MPRIAGISHFSMTCRRRSAAILWILPLCAAAVASCRRSAELAASGAAERFSITGVVRGLDSARSEITLDHEAVEGLMDAMTMPFPVRDREGLATLAVGDRLSATLVREGGRYWLEGIRKTDASESAPAAPAASATPRPNRGTRVGETIADFTLVEQTGRPVKLSEFRGQPV